jgi:hypothetical protein
MLFRRNSVFKGLKQTIKNQTNKESNNPKIREKILRQIIRCKRKYWLLQNPNDSRYVLFIYPRFRNESVLFQSLEEHQRPLAMGEAAAHAH